MSQDTSYHMTPEEFRRWGHAAVDWIADYQRRVETLPVLSQVKPGELRAQLPSAAPEHGEPFDAILADVDRLIMPGITHWQSPNFFAFFPCNNSGPSILGELLSAGLGVQGMLWATSPACTELETHVLDWLVDMLALPAKFKSRSTGGGVIQDTASSAALACHLRDVLSVPSR
jgi:aromatic-L-amino-acid decarboxylase